MPRSVVASLRSPQRDHLPTCEPSTAANYPSTIERWLRPGLGNVPINEVELRHASSNAEDDRMTPEEIDQAIADLGANATFA